MTDNLNYLLAYITVIHVISSVLNQCDSVRYGRFSLYIDSDVFIDVYF